MRSIRVDGSVCGAVLSGSVHAARRSFHGAAATQLPRHPQTEPSPTCSKSALWILSTFLPTKEARRTSVCSHVRRRCLNSAAEAASSAKTLPPSRQTADDEAQLQLKSFVDERGEGTVQEHFDLYRDPYRRGYAPSDGPRFQISDKKQDVEFPKREETLNLDLGTREKISKLYLAISHRIRHPHRIPLEHIHKLYCQLPEPRMLCLTWQWRGRLLKVMGTPPKRDMDSMLRYFALAADVKNAGLTLRRSQWNYALAFATKYAARTTKHEMESALRLWRDMEKEAKIMGNDVTFNILFDVAAKSGNFGLADMLYQEMESRGIEFNRFHHVSLIHYFGLRLDSGGIRAAYKEMVDAGEMIDTIVLNCVISGLLRCGEEDAADATYQRMKNAHAQTCDMPRRDYMSNKVVNRVLMMFTKVGKSHPRLKESLQTTVQVIPDMHTYKLLVQHNALRVGSLAKVAQYLDEMKHLRIRVHPTIFLSLAKAFYLHGGFPGSEWSAQRLDGVLAALYEAKDSNRHGFRIESWLVIWTLRAVKKCSSNEAVNNTFDALSQRWDIHGDRLEFIHAILENILNDRDMKSLGRRNGEV